MNRHDYVPKMPSQAELELVFDTSFPDIQPYLFKISYATSGINSPSMGTTVKRILKDFIWRKEDEARAKLKLTRKILTWECLLVHKKMLVYGELMIIFDAF